jgi:CheY-like chemotaxis protein
MNEPTNTSQTVLVVEDDASMRKLLVSILQQAGFTVVEAENGKDGLQSATTQHPALILTDNFMPIMNGVDMVAEIRKDAGWGATVPVIVMTNVNDMSAVNKSLQAGGIDYLMKSDVQLEQVVALVKQRLGAK